MIASSHVFCFIIPSWTGDWVCRTIIPTDRRRDRGDYCEFSTVQPGWPSIWNSTLSISNIAMATSGPRISWRAYTRRALRRQFENRTPIPCGKLCRKRSSLRSQNCRRNALLVYARQEIRGEVAMAMFDIDKSNSKCWAIQAARWKFAIISSISASVSRG